MISTIKSFSLKRPAESYFWSSHSTYLGFTTIAWLTQTWLLKKFHRHEIPARKLFANYVLKGIGISLPQELYLGSHEGRILGDDNFVEEVLNEKIGMSKAKRQLSVHDILNITAETLEVSVSDLSTQAKRSKLAQARSIAALIVRDCENVTIRELAEMLIKDPTALSRSASAIEKESLFDDQLRQAIDRVRNRVSFHCKDCQDYQV